MLEIKLEPGQTIDMGYDEYLFHPDDATEILETGSITINGQTHHATQVSYCQGYPQIMVWK